VYKINLPFDVDGSRQEILISFGNPQLHPASTDFT
jgi:hypothetical protein